MQKASKSGREKVGLTTVEVFLQMCCLSTSIFERPRLFLCLQHAPITKPIYTQTSEEPLILAPGRFRPLGLERGDLVGAPAIGTLFFMRPQHTLVCSIGVRLRGLNQCLQLVEFLGMGLIERPAMIKHIGSKHIAMRLGSILPLWIVNIYILESKPAVL